MKPLPAELRDIPADVVALVTAQVARSYRAVPVRLSGKKLVVAVTDAKEARTLRAIQFATEREVEAMVVPPPALDAALDHYYPERVVAKAAVPVPVVDDLGFDDLLPDLAADPAAGVSPDTAASPEFDDLGFDDLGPAVSAGAPAAARAATPAPGLDDFGFDDLAPDTVAEPAPGGAHGRAVAAPSPAADAALLDDFGLESLADELAGELAGDELAGGHGLAPSPARVAAPPARGPGSTAHAAGPPVHTAPPPAHAAPPSAPSPGPRVAPREPAPPPVAAPPIQRHAEAEPSRVDAAALDTADPAAVKLLSSDAARNFHALPLSLEEKTIVVAFPLAPDVKSVRAIQYATGRLVRAVLAPREALEAAILRQYPARAPRAPVRAAQVPHLDPKLLEDRDPDVIALLTAPAARKYRAVAIEKMGKRLTVAMENPLDLEAVRDLEFVAGHTVKALACDPEALAAAIEKYYPPPAEVQAENILSGADMDELDSVEVIDEDKQDEVVVDLEEAAADEAPAVRLSNLLIREGIARGASDIHIETYENSFRVRYRVDGVLYEVSHPPRQIRDALISRIKVLAGMNIAETRMPQDGRIKMRLRDRERVKQIDLRVSLLPTIWGQKVVMRILDPDRLTLDMTKLGFEESSLERFRAAIVKPYGMILVVGPSGCGKTNTLYSAMTAINSPEVNIMTCEDPVEFNVKGINQVQADEGIGRTFAVALRSFLRQDPNIILVGEVRDYETAEIAVKASLTGHLVLSTLHTTDAPTTISRLVNMGIEPFLVATSVLLVSAQRLVRRVCPECAEPDPRPESELLEMGFKPEDLPVVPMKGRGCLKCHQMGMKGRTAVFEVLAFTEAIRELVLAGATPVELRRVAEQEGMLTLRKSGLQKIKTGFTTVDEVTRETIR